MTGDTDGQIDTNTSWMILSPPFSFMYWRVVPLPSLSSCCVLFFSDVLSSQLCTVSSDGSTRVTAATRSHTQTNGRENKTYTEREGKERGWAGGERAVSIVFRTPSVILRAQHQKETVPYNPKTTTFRTRTHRYSVPYLFIPVCVPLLLSCAFVVPF